MLVSVLVAAYRPCHLPAALASALAQTHRDLEIVVVDDSDGGDVRQIVEQLDDPRIRYLPNERNLGPAASYSRAIHEASGAVIGILNDDDLWEPQLVEQLLPALFSASDVVIAFGDHWILRDGERDRGASEASTHFWRRDVLAPGVHRPFARLALVDKSIPTAVAALFRRDPLAGVEIPAEVGGAYDFFLAYVLARDGGAAVYVPERLASWRLHAGNLTGDVSSRRAQQGVAAMRIIVRDERLADIRPELRRAYAVALRLLAARYLRAGNRWGAARATLAALAEGDRIAAILLPAMLLPRVLVRSAAGRPRRET